jgi:hypothetical protein
LLSLSRVECASRIETMKFSLLAVFKDENNQKYITNQQIIDSLMYMVSSSIIVGDKKVCILGLDCLEILIRAFNPKVLGEVSSKLVGLLIRTCQYK